MKKLIVLSADALVAEDLVYLEKFPNFQKYLAGGCKVEKVTSIYPTITYPCHTTMITGVYPNKHGVCSNFEFTPGEEGEPPWLWDYKWNQCKEDIFTQAKKAGYHTAAVFWPVTGNHPCIDDLIAEYWIQNSDDTNREAFKRMGANEQMLGIIEKNLKGPGRPIHPEVDQFIVDCACDIIRMNKPDVLFIHPADIDGARHIYGTFHEKVVEKIKITDDYIGQIMKAVEENGELENTNFVLTSDHGQMNINRVLNLNVLMADYGFIHLDENGKMVDWDVWCLSNAMSSMVYLKNPDDQELYQKVYEKLCWMAEEGIYGFSKVFTKEEADKQTRFEGDFSFVLETDGFTSFGDSYHRPLVTNFDVNDYRMGKATHGYLPYKGPQPVFLAKGPDFKENIVLEHADLVDQAPTYAKLLGVMLEDSDGRPMEELLNILTDS